MSKRKKSAKGYKNTVRQTAYKREDAEKTAKLTAEQNTEKFEPIIGTLTDDQTYTSYLSVEDLEAALAAEAEETRKQAEANGTDIEYTDPIVPLRSTYIEYTDPIAPLGSGYTQDPVEDAYYEPPEPEEEPQAPDEEEPPEESDEEEVTDETGEFTDYVDPEEKALAELFGAMPEGDDEEEEEEVSRGLSEDDFYNAPEGTGAALFAENEAIKTKIKERKKENAVRNRQMRLRARIILITLAVALGLFIFSLSSIFTVDDIQVTGNDHFTGEEIRNIAHAVPGRNIIYNLGATEIIEYLEQNPYIKTAEVTRKFPSTMVINVTEREELCSFKYDDDYLLMDEEGILLKKTRNKPKTTLVKGMVVSKLKLGEKIGTTDGKLFDKVLGLAIAMRDADMYFVKIDMSDEKVVKAYIYDNLVVKTDYDTLVANLGNGRLHKVVEKLFDDNIKRGTITFNEEGSATFEPSI